MRFCVGGCRMRRGCRLDEWDETASRCLRGLTSPARHSSAAALTIFDAPDILRRSVGLAESVGEP
jgi:hypothetical protein